MSEKRKGLLLVHPNAPLTPHFIPGVSGYYRTDIPTPVGRPGELTLDLAKELDKGPELLKLVDIPAGDVARAEEVAKADLVAARVGVDRERRQRNISPALLREQVDSLRERS